MKRTLIIPILFFVDVLFFCYILWPKYTAWQTLGEGIKQRELSLKQSKEYLFNLQRTSGILEDYKEELGKIDSALPEKSSLPHLLHFFQKKVSENGLLLSDINQQTQSQAIEPEEGMAVGLKETYIGINAIGSVSSFENFLKTIEESARLVEVENISLRQEKEELFGFNLTLKVYSY